MLFSILIVFFKCLLPIIAFYIAIYGMQQKKLYNHNLSGYWFNRFTSPGKKVFTAAMMTMLLAILIEIIGATKSITAELEINKKRMLSETDIRVALIELIEPFRSMLIVAECPIHDELQPGVGFEIVPFDPFSAEIEQALFKVVLTEPFGQRDATWEAYISRQVSRAISRIELVKTKGHLKADVVSLLDKLLGDEFLGQMNTSQASSIWGETLEEQFEPDDRRHTIYKPFWDTLIQLDNLLIVNEHMLEAKGLMSPLEWQQILHDGQGIIPDKCN